MLRKLLIIIMGIFLVICAGSCNLYPLYLKIMVNKFNFTLKEVNLYGTFINLGLWVGFPMGWIYDTLGPKFSCLIGATLLSGSYFVLHIIFNGDFVNVPLIVFLLIALIMGQGSALCYTTSVTTNLKNFRFKESSAIVGLIVANLALSPSVLTTYREAMKEVKTPTYFMIISLFVLFITLICAFVFHNIRRVYNEEDQNKKTYQMYKEKKIIKFFIYLNILILIVYSFGVIFHAIWESDSQQSKFPLIIIYPCLQLLNFIVIYLEHQGIFDKMYFKHYIDKMILKQINKKEDLYKMNPNNCIENNINLDKILKDDNLPQNHIKESDLSPKDLEEKRKEIEDGILKDIEGVKSGKSLEFSEVKLDEENKRGQEQNKSDQIISLGLSNDKSEAILNNSIIVKSDESANSANVDKNKNDENLSVSFKVAVLSPNVLILFLILVLGIGSEISNLNNIEFIIISISKSPPANFTLNITDPINSNSTFSNSSNYNPYPVNNNKTGSNSALIYSYVILYFVFNSFTRIISGLILDKLIKLKKFFYYLVIMTVFGLVSQFLGIFMDQTLLLISISLAGACHGGYLTFLPVFVRNEFGLTHMGKILGFLTTGNALGSLIIADGIFIIFHSVWNIDGDCYGARCFMYSYMITTFFFIVNLFLSLLLLKRYLRKVNNN
jgi:hypothetical protein